MKTALHIFPYIVSRLKENGAQCCFLLFALFSFTGTVAQTVTTGKSFMNLTRPNGGTFAPGDLIEVRATMAVTGITYTNRITQVRYNDTINTAYFDYVPGSLQILSNEGRPQLPFSYSDAQDTDSACIRNGQFIRFNIGNGALAANEGTQGNTGTNAGALWTGLRPRFFGTTTIRVYAFRVRIKDAPTVDYGMIITLNAGNFRYRRGTTNYSSDFSPSRIRVMPDYGLCSNAMGSNAIVGESGGTFGSGTAQNRAGGTTFVPAPYTFVNFGSAAPNDNFYGLANRTSANGSTNPNVAYPNSARVHQLWDIIGDHTGAVDPIAGNPPTNTGYAVIVNASYETNRAFTQNIDGLCEETYYEFSAWFRNVCRYCGCDSTGRGAFQSGYRAGPPSVSGGPLDSAGVRPNLSFQIDGEEIYTSGNIPYTGEWVKKGFVFKTRPGQTSMTVTIRNNAPGGGGNDWAIDDISVATCMPNMSYSPSITPNVCAGNPLTLTDTIRSYFDNYTHFQWQESNDDGNSWTNIGAPGTQTPQWNATLNVWEYWTSYTTPVLAVADSGRKYRLLVATSNTNLTSSSCLFTDQMNNVTLTVLPCTPTLDAKLISFTGNVEDNLAKLKWTTTGEKEPIRFEIERSFDGIQFSTISTMHSSNTDGTENNYYSFTDPQPLARTAYYRINMRNADNKGAYSRVLPLSTTPRVFGFVSVVNPFSKEILFDLSSQRAGKAKAELVDYLGNVVKRNSFDIREGVNQLVFPNMEMLSAGIYILRVEFQGMVIHRRVLKENR